MTDKLDSFDRATLQGDSFDQLQQQSQLGQLQEAAPQAPIEEEVQPPSQEEQIELEQPVEQPLFSEKKNKDKPQEEAEPQEKEFTAGDYAGELAMSVPRGVEGAVEGVWNFFDFATGDRLWDFYDRKKYSWLGRPETGVGKAGEAIVQFATGFIPGVRLASWLGKASKLKGAAATLSKSKEAIKSFSKNQLSLSAKSMKNLSRLKSATKTNVKFATGGAISEFFVFKGEEQRLANLLATHESGGGPVQDVINWLAYDPDDENSNELIERGKFALEGLIVGEVIGLGLLGVGKGYRAVRPKREVVEVTSESAIKAPENGEAVSALQKIFGVFARKNANVKQQLKEGGEVDEFKALNDALNDPELQVTPNEALALRESAHRNNDLKNATDWEEQTGEALSKAPRPRGVEEAIRETLDAMPSSARKATDAELEKGLKADMEAGKELGDLTREHSAHGGKFFKGKEAEQARAESAASRLFGIPEGSLTHVRTGNSLVFFNKANQSFYKLHTADTVEILGKQAEELKKIREANPDLVSDTVFIPLRDEAGNVIAYGSKQRPAGVEVSQIVGKTDKDKKLLLELLESNPMYVKRLVETDVGGKNIGAVLDEDGMVSVEAFDFDGLELFNLSKAELDELKNAKVARVPLKSFSESAQRSIKKGNEGRARAIKSDNEIDLKGDPWQNQTKTERAASRAAYENVRKRWDAKKEAAKKFNTDTATEKRLDEYFLSKGVTAANSTLQSKRAIAKDMMNESKVGGKEHLIETIDDHVAKTVKEAGLYDKTNPRAMASGVRVLNSVPEMRGFLLHASKVAMKASKQGKMSPKAQEKFYEETSKIANRGYEAAGGKGELDLSVFRGRTKDLELFRSEAETLYHALNGVAKDLKDKVASAEYALKNGTAKVQTPKGATVLNKDEAMTEVFSTMDRWTALQEIWADFGTQLSLGMRQRNDLYLTGQSALGRDIAGQHRTLGVALEDAMKKQGEIYRRQNRGNLSDKRIIKDLQKLFKNSGEVLDMNQMAKDFNQIGVNRGLSQWTLAGRKGLAVSQEWYYNAILGSPTSWAVNFLGGALVLPLRHIESIAGGVMTGNVKLVKANFRAMFDVQSFKDSLKYAWKSGIDDEARSITGFTAFRDDRILKKGGEIRVDNADGTLLRSAFNFIGHVVRHPTRAMMVGDEFFKQMSYRARIKTSLAVDGYQKGLHREPGKLAEHIQNGFNTTITAKGRFRNEENIRREAVEALVAARKAGEDITDERKFINGYMKDHYDTNKLKRVKDVVYDDSIGFSQREALVEAGKDWALVNTFTNEVTNTFFKKTGEMAQMSPWMGFVIPFVRTPSNILLFALGRSIPRPIKLVKEMANVRKTKKNFEDFDAKTFADDAAKKADFGEMRQARENAQRYLNLIQNESGIKSAEAIGRLSTGILSTGALLMNIEALGERITGSPPSDPGKRAAWAATGKIPFAVQWGDKWHSYQRLDPFATTLGMMADISKGFSDMRDTGVSEFGDEEEFEEKKNEFFQVISIITTAIADNTMKKSYIENLGELLDVMEKPAESFEKVGGNILGGFVPNGLNWSQNVFEEEPAILEARGLLDKIRKRLPESMRPGGKIMPQRNAFGEIRRKSKDNTGDIRQEPLDLIKGLNPLFSSEISNDIVDIEIEHQAVGRKPMGDVRNIAGNRLSYRDYRNDKDQTAYDRMQELSGTVKLGPSQITLRQKLRRLIESNAYQRLPPITEKNKHRDHPRSKAITKVINSYRAEARRQTHREFKELRADLANLLR